MAKCVFLLRVLVLNFFSGIVFAYDPSPLQDFCVADLTGTGNKLIVSIKYSLCQFDI